MTDAAKASGTPAKDTAITPRIATAFGFGAVLLWSTLASLTSLKWRRYSAIPDHSHHLPGRRQHHHRRDRTCRADAPPQ